MGEFGISAEVMPVYIATANKAAIDFLEGTIREDEAKRRGARMQIWGEIEQGQKYQHAVCFIKDWAVIVDLAMATRASKLVPSHLYWALDRFPWWLYSFEFETYHLEYRGYETHPEQVQKAKEIIRKLIMSFIEISAGFDQGQRFHYTELAGEHKPFPWKDKRTDKGLHGERGSCDYAALCAMVSKFVSP